MRGDRGFALLEVMLATVLLGTAGIAMASLQRESVASAERARSAERSTASALRLLDAVSLWAREDLDRHLGDRPEGPWRLSIQRPTAALYQVGVADSAGHEVLRTVLYRPEVLDAKP